jgi:hypothetical protein
MDRFLRRSVPVFGGTLLMVAVAIFTSPLAYGQVTTGSIEGTVHDENGKPAQDVEIVAKNQSSGYYQIAYTSDNGKYRIPSLTPGTYQIRAANLNFAPLTKTGIHVEIDEVSIIDFSLTSKGIQEKEVVVEARAPIVDTKNSDLSTAVRPEQINSLPLNSRNFLELASVAPGSKLSVGGRGPITTGAVNSRFITAYLDGGEFKSDGLGGVLGTSFGVTTNIVPEDAISQFQVITTMYKAEFSSASNGVVNAITKSGGNEIHGSAFSFFRSSGLNAQGVFEKTKPDYNRQQLGFSVGGPIILDQTHYFVSYERDNINNFITVNTGGKLNGTIDGTFKSPTTENLFLARVTHQFNETNQLDMRYLTVATDNNPGNFGGVSSYTNGFNLGFRINSFVATDRWTINNNTVNELKLQYQHYFKDATPVTTTPEFVYQTFATGWNPNQPQNEDYQRLELRDDVNYLVSDMAGSHAFKAGVDFEREPLASKAEFDKGGVIVFLRDTSTVPTQGVVGLGNAQTRSLNYKYGVYIQDDWTVIPNLTLNLGLRWDVETNMINNSYVNPLAGDTALTNHVPANYIGNGNRPIDYGRIAPRLGFAYDVFGDHSTAIHGGFGIFYDRFIYNLSSNEQQNGVYNIYTVVFGPSAPPTTNRDSLISYVQRNLGGASAPGVSLNPSSVPSPYTQQITVGVSHQLTPDIAASLDYIQIRGFNEYTTYNVNYQKGIGGPRVATPRYAGIALLTSTGKSWYDAYQLSITRPYLGDWQMQLSYTLSWADNTFDDPFQGYVFQSSIVRTPSLQDERHHFVLSGIVDLPFDFQISGLITLSSPHPYGPASVVTGVDNNVDGTRADDYPGGPDGRNNLRPPTDHIRYWYKDVDLRITKNIEITQSYKLGLFVEAFNLFNWTNYSNFFTTQSASNFGQPNGAYPTRQVQLGVRAYF